LKTIYESQLKRQTLSKKKKILKKIQEKEEFMRRIKVALRLAVGKQKNANLD